MSVIVITGSAGLIGSEAVTRFHEVGHEVWGIDNDMSGVFFGEEASTLWMRRQLEARLGNYRHFDVDIRDQAAIADIFRAGGQAITAVVHAAAQPSHDGPPAIHTPISGSMQWEHSTCWKRPAATVRTRLSCSLRQQGLW